MLSLVFPMQVRQSFTFSFESSDQPSVFVSEVLQMVCLNSAEFGCSIWFRVEQIPQLEQLLNLLWSMKDEQAAAVTQAMKDQEAIAHLEMTTKTAA
jgi:hypothetical protein